MAEPSVLSEVKDGVGIVTLNKPEKLNAWDGPMRLTVKAAIEKFNADKSVRAIILTGAGDRAFCAGQDLGETSKFTGGSEGAAWFETWRAFYDCLRNSTKPVVAALNGVAAGSAYQFAMLCDVRVGHPGSRMGQPEINSGIPSVLGPLLMIERLGLSRTIELTLTGRMMEAKECQQIGLMHHLVPQKKVMAKAMEVAKMLAAKPPIAMRLNKQRFREVTQPAFDEAFLNGRRIQEEAYASGEPQASMEAFFAARAKAKGAKKAGAKPRAKAARR
ncbi:MAG: enoyl-CoA hydratase/isomerase family protein [Alphaproteobacteria bacterium]|nr:enoyl-CoA hydratase/isomerase family protein [Alphaproteobacteria bacterium]